MADTGKRVLNFSAGPAKLPEEVSNKLIFRAILSLYFLSGFISLARVLRFCPVLSCPVASPFYQVILKFSEGHLVEVKSNFTLKFSRSLHRSLLFVALRNVTVTRVKIQDFTE